MGPRRARGSAQREAVRGGTCGTGCGEHRRSTRTPQVGPRGRRLGVTRRRDAERPWRGAHRPAQSVPGLAMYVSPSDGHHEPTAHRRNAPVRPVAQTTRGHRTRRTSCVLRVSCSGVLGCGMHEQPRLRDSLSVRERDANDPHRRPRRRCGSCRRAPSRPRRRSRPETDIRPPLGHDHGPRHSCFSASWRRPARHRDGGFT